MLVRVSGTEGRGLTSDFGLFNEPDEVGQLVGRHRFLTAAVNGSAPRFALLCERPSDIIDGPVCQRTVHLFPLLGRPFLSGSRVRRCTRRGDGPLEKVDSGKSLGIERKQGRGSFGREAGVRVNEADRSGVGEFREVGSEPVEVTLGGEDRKAPVSGLSACGLDEDAPRSQKRTERVNR